MAVAELGAAADPVVVPPASGAEPALRIVQDAPIAHQRPAPGLGGDFAGGGDAVLEGHYHHPPGEQSGGTGGEA